VLTAWDLALFSRYCELETIAREAWGKLREFGTVVEGRRDWLVSNPYWRIYRDAIDRQRALGHEFGLTPSGRSGLFLAQGDPLESERPA
jgi:P27 family predicted phage terminase small subunit